MSLIVVGKCFERPLGAGGLSFRGPPESIRRAGYDSVSNAERSPRARRRDDGTYVDGTPSSPRRRSGESLAARRGASRLRAHLRPRVRAGGDPAVLRAGARRDSAARRLRARRPRPSLRVRRGGRIEVETRRRDLPRQVVPRRRPEAAHDGDRRAREERPPPDVSVTAALSAARAILDRGPIV